MKSSSRCSKESEINDRTQIYLTLAQRRCDTIVATLYTIGHSTRPLDEFVAVLQAHSIQTLTDIRSLPASRRLPHFNREALEKSLDLGQGALTFEREVLADHGNMSAPTVLFVLERALAAKTTGRLVMTALGPGFTTSCLSMAA